MKKFILYFIILIFVINNALATHNRAGEIVYRQISQFTYEITLYTYTSTKPDVLADRPELEIFWGDNTSNIVPRLSEEFLPNYYKKNTYIYVHTFPGNGTFEIFVQDPNRNSGVKNIPNSVEVVFALKTTLKINSTIGFNNTPILLNPPIENAAKDLIFIHNPNAYDSDGDSLSYSLEICLSENGQPIDNYTYPKASNFFKIDEITGDLIWDSPVEIGIYNMAIGIHEWRNGIKIGTIIRDMQVEVYETDNNPPKIAPIGSFCIEAGEMLKFTVSATDEDGENITLESNSGIFKLANSPAKFDQPKTGSAKVSSEFEWQTECLHVRKQPYIAIFKVKDDNPDQVLVDYENVSIQVVGPATENLKTKATNSSIELSWDKNKCDEVKGYYIYRKKSKTSFTPGNCELGVPKSTGYKKIATIEGNDKLSYLDNNNGDGLVQGYQYCYMVVAYYADGAESYASKVVCGELAKGVPIMIKVSVLKTEKVNGEVHLQWIKPIDFDQITNPGPYRYTIFPSNDLTGSSYTNPFYVNGIDNTTYTDIFNTVETPRIYKMGLFNYDSKTDTWNIIGVPEKASSTFLTTYASDNQVQISINHKVPWENTKYIIYRQNPTTLQFDEVGTSTEPNYTDKGLKNGIQYCYKVKTIGQYGLADIPSPLENYSQITCATPIDTIPPCVPKLKISSKCDEGINELSWTSPNETCLDDAVEFNIYYSNTTNGEYKLIKTFDDNKITNYEHIPELSLTGCYVITAVDSFKNESSKDYKVCIDECISYKLPNVFTPDGNGINDIYKPYEYDFVKKVDMKIFNRWGTLVYKTENPEINWDGKDIKTNKMVSNGVYYYVCDVYEYRLGGLEIRNISGFIHVLTNDGNSKSK